MVAGAAPTAPRAATRKVVLGLVAAGLYTLVGVLAVRVRGGTAPLRVDRAISDAVDSARLGNAVAGARIPALWPHGLLGQLVGVGFPLGATTVALALACFAWVRRDLRGLALSVAGPALAVVMTDIVLKPLVDRHIAAGGLAYPSGHAAGAAAVSALALVLLHRWRGWRSTAWLAPLAAALPAAMGLALVRLAFHYPTDIVGGAALGVATVVALAVLLDAERSNPAPGRPPPEAVPVERSR